jgi:hypothetical protein
MKWEKCGKICDHNTFNMKWFKKNAMMPLPYLIDEKIIRVFLTMCDEYNVGRIGYIDVDASNPRNILDYSQDPIIDIGESGTFDDNGVVTGSLFEKDEVLYMFYSGYQLCRKIPYMIFSGVAESFDKGRTFAKLTKNIPLLDRVATEKNFRCVPNIIQQDATFKMWYLADCPYRPAWMQLDTGKMQPCYLEKYIESQELLKWDGEGRNVFDFENDDEHGLSIGSIWHEEDLYKCIYSIRSISKGYRLGYAESKDGLNFIRKDNELNIDVSENDFDSEMMCYPKRIQVKDAVYLFYSGNHYGMEGIGYMRMA